MLPTPAGGAHPKIAILFAPAARPDRTVFATNLEDGWSTMANCVAGGLRGFHVQVRSSGAHVDFPVHSLQVWRDGNMLRVVQVIRDTDRWEFFEQGPVQTFEHPDHYRRPRKRDRLTREHLVQYLRSLGWDVSDPDFWRSKSDAVYYTEERR